jgi:signal transduction histidine kinase/CheY-like chemotaxis protein
MGALELIADLTSRLASTAVQGEVAASAAPVMASLGFGLVWIAGLDEQVGSIATLRVERDGDDVTREMPPRIAIDPRQPLGHAFRDRRMVNVHDAHSLHVLERDDDRLPSGAIGLTRAAFDRVRGHPFACGPLLGADGEPIGALCLGSYRGQRVIPDEVLANGDLRAMIDLLSIAIERARQRGQLAHATADLARAQAMLTADAHIKSVGEIAAATTHDLNHFCTLMQGAIEISARSPSDAAAELPRIKGAHHSIVDLVARLRRVASPAQPTSEAVELGQIVDDLVVITAARLRAHTIEVDCALPQLPPVRCDPTLLRRVVLNLIANAEDALAEVAVERRKVQIRAREDAGTVRLTVTDSGPGIPPDVMVRLFHSVFTTKRDGHHMGLGLAACQAELAPFGARLEARNTLTGGAELELVVQIATSRSEPARPGARAAVDPRDVRVLVVDDDPDMVDMILDLLEPVGFQISTATTSAHALELAARQPFDLVLCDISMPKQSGLEISRALRTAGYDGKIILMTGLETPTLSSDVRDAASDRLLKKPFGSELVQLIESLLRG